MIDEKNLLNLEETAFHLEATTKPSQSVQQSLLRRYETDAVGAFAQLPIFVRTVGGDRTYAFETYELTSNSVYVICKDLKKYPFQYGSTLLEIKIKLNLPDNGEEFYFSALAKMERPVDRSAINESMPSGFALKLVQSNFDDRKKYDLFIEAHKQVAVQAQ